MKNTKKQSDFVRYCLELLAPVSDDVTVRAMFGGYGIYRNRAIFGLIADDRLYFKVDEHSLPLYEKHQAEPFTYARNGKSYQMSYYEVPVSILEDQHELCRFVEEACAATRRSAHH